MTMTEHYAELKSPCNHWVSQRQLKHLNIIER